MSLRLVKGGSRSATGGQETGGVAFLLVGRGGTVLASQGWETVSADPAPRRLGEGADDDPIVRSIGEVVSDVRKTGRPAARRVEVSLERPRTYGITAGPISGKGKDEAVAVAVQEAPAAQAGRAEGQVIRQLGHDLRTPLTSISGAVELLQSGRLGSVAPQQERVLGMMQKGVDAMVRLIDEATTPFRKDLAADLGLSSIEDLGRAVTGGDGPGAGEVRRSGAAPSRSKRGRR
jgi:signal transduction histidine kinase